MDAAFQHHDQLHRLAPQRNLVPVKQVERRPMNVAHMQVVSASSPLADSLRIKEKCREKLQIYSERPAEGWISSAGGGR